MAQKTIQGNEFLAKQIKLRRKELGLTIEEAASRAGVGTKTWCRYEAGESIRMDKCKGICKALNWYNLPDQLPTSDTKNSINEYKKLKAWSTFLEDTFGNMAAISFAVGSDILLDHINEDMSELASMPIQTHIGQLNVSWLVDSLPKQFLMHYNYDFLYQMKCVLLHMRMRAKAGGSMVAHSVMEELLFYLCCEESSAFMELSDEICEFEDEDTVDYREWIFDLFDDMDIITFLYSNMYLDETHSYHFSHWLTQQFYME